MYKIKEVGIIKFDFGTNEIISKQIGINKCSLSRILNGLTTTKYTTAYCITKLFDPEKEVLDFFEKID